MNQSQIVAARRARNSLRQLDADVCYFPTKAAHGPEEDFASAVARKDHMQSNPITKQLNLNRYPGWTIRQYADGTWDASHRHGALSTVVGSFEDALTFVRWSEQ